MAAADGGVPTWTDRQPDGPRPDVQRMTAAFRRGQLNNPDSRVRQRMKRLSGTLSQTPPRLTSPLWHFQKANSFAHKTLHSGLRSYSFARQLPIELRAVTLVSHMS